MPEIASSKQVVDPITFEVIRHKLWSINQEGSATMIHVSGSPVVHGNDYNFGIYTAEGEMAVVGVYVLETMYASYMAIREFLGRYEDIEDGDVFILNDPFIAADHQSDVQFFLPFFHGGELVAWLGCMAHQVDLGGMDPGSWCPFATDSFQEGLLIPPGRIVRRGKVNQELWDVVMANTRMPFTVANDFTAFLAGLRVAKERLAELCDRYGAEVVKSTMDQAIEGSEKALREMLTKLPDGVFTHETNLDRPGAGEGEVDLVRVSCKLEKRGDRLIFDYDDSDPQSNAYGMSTRSATLGALGCLILTLFGSELPWNQGLMRPVEMVAEEGLCVTAVSPAPVSGGSAASNWVAMCAAAGCISKLVSFSDELEGYAIGPGEGSWQLAQFGGLNQYGEPFATMYLDSLLWGGAAFSFRDGVDTGGAMMVPGGGAEDVEQQEVTSPFLYLWRRQVADSGGAGRNRGGNGIEFALTPIDTEELTGVLATHGVALPLRTGLFGGLPGACGRFELVAGSDVQRLFGEGKPVEDLRALGGEFTSLPGVTAGVRVRQGDIVNVRVANGGGYGDPIDREPERVLADVLAGGVSREWAERAYGVVVGDDAVDAEATAARREQIRSERRERMSPPADPAATGAGAPPAEGGWGDSLRFSGGAGEETVHCAHCDAALGDATADWRLLAGTIELDQSDLGAYVQVDGALRVLQYVCPSCAAALWSEVVRPGTDQAPYYELSASGGGVGA